MTDFKLQMASRLERCCSDVSDWCERKQLQLNAGKTEVPWFGSASQLRGLRPDTMHITINQSTIKQATVVRDLCVLSDGLWSDDAEPRSTDRFAVLRCFTSAAYRTSLSTNFSVPVAYCCTRSFLIRLLQQCPVWTSC